MRAVLTRCFKTEGEDLIGAQEFLNLEYTVKNWYPPPSFKPGSKYDTGASVASQASRASPAKLVFLFTI